MDFDVEKFSYRLTVLLEENNLKQTELAKEVNTTNVTICRYLSGERTPRVDIITKIASFFNVSVDYLLGTSDDRNIEPSSGNYDLDMAILVKKLYSLDTSSNLSKTQIELIKNLLLANKDFILSA